MCWYLVINATASGPAIDHRVPVVAVAVGRGRHPEKVSTPKSYTCIIRVVYVYNPTALLYAPLLYIGRFFPSSWPSIIGPLNRYIII